MQGLVFNPANPLSWEGVLDVLGVRRSRTTELWQIWSFDASFWHIYGFFMVMRCFTEQHRFGQEACQCPLTPMELLGHFMFSVCLGMLIPNTSVMSEWLANTRVGCRILKPVGSRRVCVAGPWPDLATKVGWFAELNENPIGTDDILLAQDWDFKDIATAVTFRRTLHSDIIDTVQRPCCHCCSSVCPVGWRVADNQDFIVFAMQNRSLASSNYGGEALKATDMTRTHGMGQIFGVQWAQAWGSVWFWSGTQLEVGQWTCSGGKWGGSFLQIMAHPLLSCISSNIVVKFR